MQALSKQLALVVFALLISGSVLAATVPAPGPKDRCPVCGMFVAPYPDWVAAIALDNGKWLYFDGCKDLFRYYFASVAGKTATAANTFSGIYVTEYYTTQFVPAREVFYVLGSDVLGPMGKELIPVAGQEQAETFMRDHSGRRILRFDEVRPELLPGT